MFRKIFESCSTAREGESLSSASRSCGLASKRYTLGTNSTHTAAKCTCVWADWHSSAEWVRTPNVLGSVEHVEQNDSRSSTDWNLWSAIFWKVLFAVDDIQRLSAGKIFTDNYWKELCLECYKLSSWSVHPSRVMKVEDYARELRNSLKPGWLSKPLDCFNNIALV